MGTQNLILELQDLIKHKDKFLLHKKNCDDFWNLVGGRVKSGESTTSAIKRELKEELNIDAKDLKLITIAENFFTYRKTKYHELLFVYKYICTDEEITSMQNFTPYTPENEDMVFCWYNKNQINNLKCKPELIYDLIEHNHKTNETYNNKTIIR